MHVLLNYLKTLKNMDARHDFAHRCGVTLGSMRSMCSQNKRFGVLTVVRIVRESNGEIRPSDLRPDINWDTIEDAVIEGLFEEKRDE